MPEYIPYRPYFEPAYVSPMGTIDMKSSLGLRKNDCSSQAGFQGDSPLRDDCDQVPQPAYVGELKGRTSVSLDSLEEIGGLLKAVAALPSGQISANSFYPQQGNHTLDQPLPQESQPRFRKHARNRKRMCILRIATHLNELEGEDPNKVLILRRINRLGFDSETILKGHYERYGPICKVLLSNSHAKKPDTGFPVRLRPSGIGYLVFEHAESAAKALEAGETQFVAFAEIRVRAFEGRRRKDSNDSGTDGEDGNEANFEVP
jgi:hypothetical protein